MTGAVNFNIGLVAILCAAVLQLSAACEEAKGIFKNEKGNFLMSWCFPSDDDIEITFSLDGNAFIGLGFGGSMYDADMVVGWMNSDGTPYISDYYSEEEAMPMEDTKLGGTNDIEIISGSNTTTSTTLTFRRKLVTGDRKFDNPISLTEQNDMIYAWGVADETGLVYHGDNHNHIFVDFTKADGIPDSAFGEEESGKLSRELTRAAYYGTLSTIQTEAAGSGSVYNYPYGSVADVADEEPSTGRPLLLLSDLERNVVNLKQNPRMSIEFITLPETLAQLNNPDLYDVMTKPRTTLMGQLEPVPEDELEASKTTYLKKHPESAAWINFSDFTLYRMVVEDVYVVGGFGNDHYIGWIAPEQYLSVDLD